MMPAIRLIRDTDSKASDVAPTSRIDAFRYVHPNEDRPSSQHPSPISLNLPSN